LEAGDRLEPRLLEDARERRAPADDRLVGPRQQRAVDPEGGLGRSDGEGLSPAAVRAVHDGLAVEDRPVAAQRGDRMAGDLAFRLAVEREEPVRGPDTHAHCTPTLKPSSTTAQRAGSER